ncbi:MAG: S8 family serine peptidase [Salinibacter sp.]
MSGGSDRKASSSVPRAYALRVRDSTALRRLLGRWREQSGVRYAHANYRFQVEDGSMPTPRHRVAENALSDSLDHLDVVGARSAWPVTRGDPTVEIGIVDTGVYLDHPDLRSQFWTNAAEDLNNNGRLDPGDLNGVDDDGNGFVDDVVGYDFVDRASPIQEGEFQTRDPDPSADPTKGGSGHGTAVAGVAGASVEARAAGVNGVAPDARLVALRAFGGDGFGQSDDIAAAIVYGASMGVDVLNLSFGRTRSVPVIRDAIEYASRQGTIVVASAGNKLTDDPHYPSDYPQVLSVLWLAEDGEGLPTFNRSQFGIGVDVGAPGSDVYTTNFPSSVVQAGDDPTQEELYQSYTGSSFSAPQVAGAAALLRSVDSTLSPASVRSVLTGTAEDLADENWDHTTGAGLLNVSAALGRSYPATTQILRPDHNQGFHERTSVPVVGTAVDPSFRHFAVYYARGTRDFDTRTDPWIQLRSPTPRQALRDTLTQWDLSSLDAGEYTLRLVTTLQDGRTIEDRRRVIVDRTPPTLSVRFLGSGRVEGENGIVGDLETDDRTRLTTRIQLHGTETTVQSERVARRHGLTWSEQRGRGGTAAVRITAENASGLQTTLDTTLSIPPDRENTALFRRTVTDVPRGKLLPTAPDFDADGLPELVLNRSANGGVTDSLRTYEWTGEGFALADSLRARFFPRAIGDTDQNGRQELLLQVRGGTLLLEQPTPTSFPDSLVFADTIGANTSLSSVANGAALADLDDDGQGEVLATSSREIIGFERTPDGVAQAFTLRNPTGTAGRDSALGNAFDTPKLLAGDFDADGQGNLLAGDRDGDLVLYESTGDNALSAVWTQETARVDAGNRFAKGNFVPGEGTEFATMTTYFRGTLDNGEFAPPISRYSIWRSTGDDQYARAYRLPVAGTYTDLGSMTAADVDEDDVDELIISHAPSLLVADRAGDGSWRVRYANDAGAPLQSRSLTAVDLTGDGHPSIVAETAGNRLVRFAVDERALAGAPPRWVRARPTGRGSGVLEWRAPGADSVVVYAGPPDGPLDRVAVRGDSSYTVTGTRTRRYALRAWEGGTPSPLSSPRTVRPHAPASLTRVRYPTAATVQLHFDEPLQSGLRSEQFRFGPDAIRPEHIVQSEGRLAVTLHYRDDVTGQSARLRWADVSDADGLAVADTAALVSFPAAERASLFIQEADILDERRVRLVFNEPLPRAAATDAARYEIRPRGRVADVTQADDAPSTVTVRVEGVVIGPSGRETSLRVTEMQSTRGDRLSKEGSTVRLTRPAEDLSNVYLYPNPYRPRRQDGGLTIAGLPGRATVRVYTPGGRLVRVLSVDDNRDGAAEWDLLDRRGRTVPSGVYLFRVNAPNQSPVLEKAAVIR